MNVEGLFPILHGSTPDVAHVVHALEYLAKAALPAFANYVFGMPGKT